MSATVNEALYTSTIKHQIGLFRLANAQVFQIAKLLDEVDKDLAAQIAKRAAAGKSGFTSLRLEAMLKEIRGVTIEAYRLLEKRLREDLLDLADYEATWQQQALASALPINVSFLRPTREQLQAAVFDTHMVGSTLTQEVSQIAANRFKAIQGAVRLGFVEGQTIPQIVARVVGSAEEAGVLSVTRAQAASLVRTSVNHVATSARMRLLKANQDVVNGYLYTATLDGRTTARCASLDGKTFKLGEGPLPPQHFGCRSCISPLTKGYEELGLKKKELDALPPATRASMNGQVPESQRFSQFLRARDAAGDTQFVETWFRSHLGRNADDLLATFRANPALDIDKLVTASGDPITLHGLAKLDGIELPSGVAAKPVVKSVLEQALQEKAAAEAAAKVAAEAAAKAAIDKAAVEHSLEAKSFALKQAGSDGALLTAQDGVKIQAAAEATAKQVLAGGGTLEDALAEAKNVADNKAAGLLAKAKVAEAPKIVHNVIAGLLPTAEMQALPAEEIGALTKTLERRAAELFAQGHDLAAVKFAVKVEAEDLVKEAFVKSKDAIGVKGVQDALEGIKAIDPLQAPMTYQKALDNIQETLKGLSDAAAKPLLGDVLKAQLKLDHAIAKATLAELKQAAKAAGGVNYSVATKDALKKFLGDVLGGTPLEAAQADLTVAANEAFQAKKLEKAVKATAKVEPPPVAAVPPPPSTVKPGALVFEPGKPFPVSGVNGLEFVPGKVPTPSAAELALGKGIPAKSGDFLNVFVQESDGRVWMVEPQGHFASYEWTGARGKFGGAGNAVKEAVQIAFDRMGFEVEITDYLGAAQKATSGTVSHNVIARRVAGVPLSGSLTQAMRLVDLDEAIALANQQNDKLALLLMKDRLGVKLTVLERKLLVSMVDSGKAVLPKWAEGLTSPFEQVKTLDGTGWKQIGQQAGSNPGGLYQASDGQSWYVKFAKSSDTSRLREELAANRLYAAAGVNVPDLELIVIPDGRVGIASKIVSGQTGLKGAALAKTAGVHDAFVADAWLSNWDVAGASYDNLLVAGGKAYRIDVGGALRYRAQGEAKGSLFGDSVNELLTLRDAKVNPQTASVFAGLSDEAILKQIRALSSVMDDKTIRQILQSVPSLADADVLAAQLARRRDWLVNYADDLELKMKQAKLDAAMKELAKLRGEAAPNLSEYRLFTSETSARNWWNGASADSTDRVRLHRSKLEAIKQITQEYESVRAYTASYYREMNRRLRFDYKGIVPKKGGDRYVRWIRDLTATLENCIVPEHVTVFLGTHLDGDILKEVVDLEVGGTWTDQGFLSSAGTMSKAWQGNVVFEFKLPAGAKGWQWVEPISSSGGELEIVGTRGQKWRLIEKKRWVNPGNLGKSWEWHFVMELIAE